MARESPGYRDQLESIITAFPKGERLTVADVAHTAKAMPPLAPPDAPLPVRCMISCPILLAQTLTGCCTGGVADAWRRQNRNYNPFRLRQRHRYRYRNHAHAERVQLVRKEQSVCRCNRSASCARVSMPHPGGSCFRLPSGDRYRRQDHLRRYHSHGARLA